MADKKITIKDIAKMANVSPGTVDRVIHNRGKVSEDKKQKVDEVLQRIDYEPNLIAKTLKKNRTYRIAILMPDPSRDKYWERALRGIEKAAKDFGSFGIIIDHFYFQPASISSFESATTQILLQKPAGVLAVPMFMGAAENFFKKCVELAIPIVTFNTHHESGLPSCFIGQDLFQSGRVAANLISMTQPFTGRILLIHIDETPDNTSHVFEKEKGVKSFLQERGYDMGLVESYQFFHGNGRAVIENLQNEIELDQNISAVFVSTSRAYEIATTVKRHCEEAIIVGYDLIKQNVELVEAGAITYLIDQNPFEQAYLGISRFSDYFVFQKELGKEDLLPLHVTFRENIQSVIDNKM